MKEKIYINAVDWIDLSKTFIGLTIFIGIPLYIINGVNFSDLFERYLSLGIAFTFYFLMFATFAGFKIPRRKVYLKTAMVEK